jgi:protein involved in polysaccharide export with SLBB domain
MSMEWNPMTNDKSKAGIASRLLHRFTKTISMTSCLVVAGLSTGCTALTQPITGIPVRRLPPQFLAQTKNNLVALDPARLSQEPMRQYLLDAGDVLGVYIEGILPYSSADKPPEPPPVNFPGENSTLDPSIGFPIAVQENGTIALPSIAPIKVKGLNIEQVTNLIRKAYLEAKIVRDGDKLRPSVTILKERTYNIVVVRQDQSSSGSQGSAKGGYIRGADQSSSGKIVKLAAYRNDVLNALIESGGLPGVNAKNEVRILKSNKANQQARDSFIQQFYQTYYSNPSQCSCPPPLPDDPAVTKIPMRLPPGVIPTFRPEDILLEDGDVVYIESRDAEVFYTGGLLPGGEWAIPRDYDLDVLGAMAMAGTGLGSKGQGGGGGGFGVGMIGGVPPGILYILRKTPCDGQVTIEVDLAEATTDPRSRPLVMPGDTLVLRYKPCEEVLNFTLGSFFTFGFQFLLQPR